MRLMIAAALAALALPSSAHEAHAQMPVAAPIKAPTGTYKVDPTHSSITWRVRHMGLSGYTARFAKFDSTVAYDAADPTRSKLEVTIDPNSVRTDYPFPEKENFDAKVAKDFLAADKGPIRFVSRTARRTGDDRGQITGDLTMGGVTKPVTLDARWNGAITHPFSKTPVFGVSATGRVKRSEFGLGAGAPMIGDDVELVIEAEYGL